MHPVIAPDRLALLLDAPAPPVLLDVRWSLTGPPGRQEYATGHLPGAVFVDVDVDLAGAPGAAGRHPLPEPASLQAVLRAAGVRHDRPVVAYDAADSSVAARAWWLLRWAGHREVAVLDGGYRAWVDRGLPVTTAAPQPAAGTITVHPGMMPVLDTEQAADLAGAGGLLDARAQPRYRGEHEQVDPRAGHIPGARNAPFALLTDAGGRWLPAARLRELAAEWGVTGLPVGVYCGSGVTACSLVLGLELAGFTTPEVPAALYAGSWSQWCA
ncbi:MAG: sulfurtransferase, partial [Pseudonocardiaceae bacterium]